MKAPKTMRAVNLLFVISVDEIKINKYKNPINK